MIREYEFNIICGKRNIESQFLLHIAMSIFLSTFENSALHT